MVRLHPSVPSFPWLASGASSGPRRGKRQSAVDGADLGTAAIERGCQTCRQLIGSRSHSERPASPSRLRTPSWRACPADRCHSRSTPSCSCVESIAFTTASGSAEGLTSMVLALAGQRVAWPGLPVRKAHRHLIGHLHEIQPERGFLPRHRWTCSGMAGVLGRSCRAPSTIWPAPPRAGRRTVVLAPEKAGGCHPLSQPSRPPRLHLSRRRRMHLFPR